MAYLVTEERRSSRNTISEGAAPRVRVWMRLEKDGLVVFRHWGAKELATALSLKDARWYTSIHRNASIEPVKD